jgi:hypothetical protein
MNARVPQDVDLEDRLIYGLSPVRFGYLVIAALGALSAWRIDVLPVGVRAVPCMLLLAAGAALAWGRWRDRPLDHWVVDVAVYIRRNYRVGPASRGGLVRLTAIRAINHDGRSR